MAHTNKISFYKNATAAQDRATARTNLANALGDNDVVNGELVLSSYTENNTEKTIFGIKRTNGYTIFDPVDLKSVDLKATNSGLENNNGLGVVVDGTTIDFDGQGRLTATGGGGQPITYSGDGNSIDVTNQTISAIVKSQGGILVDSTTSDNHGLYVDTSKIQRKLSQGEGVVIDNSGTDTDHISVRVKSQDAQGSFANALDCDMYGLYVKIKSNGGLSLDSNNELYVDATWDCGTY